MARFQRRDLLKPLGILVAIIAAILAAAGVEKEIIDDEHGPHLTVSYTGFGFEQTDHLILGRRWRRAVYLRDDAYVAGAPRTETVFLGSGEEFCPFETRSLSGRLMAKGLCRIAYEMQIEKIPRPQTEDVRSATYFDEKGDVASTVDENGVGTQSYIRDDGELKIETITDGRRKTIRWYDDGKLTRSTAWPPDNWEE